MNFEKQMQRISKIINDMPMREFEGMLFDCGLGIIGPSEESDFVKCFSMNFLENGEDYARKNQDFLQEDYQNLNSFDIDGQEVA